MMKDARVPRYVGYCTELPVKAGDRIVVPAGVTVTSLHPKKPMWVTKRRLWVTVRMIMNGRSFSPEHSKRSEVERAAGSVEAVVPFYAEYEALRTALRASVEGSQLRIDLWRRFANYRIPVNNPRVEWAGPGSYWTGVDINDILEENGL